ncbi:hypothetical protein Tamer19_12130 [Cupriavidus sp. TA19]|uniref:tyrosine-type recombinase/integrase n=1 Tax=Cupriavidus sp. TA19 TaxID=701108 RepID=UPI0027294BD9|nr:tyrosine-type recombinase/integrase [Cupriavidus sp. TA19]GLC91805.1 hypothetical protein Tamer19_12130 [Cupriavidus sp. TA19]
MLRLIEPRRKGSKPREIPLTDEVLHELSLYRQSFGLPASIAPRDETPLIFSIQVKERFRPITRQALYTVFKGMFEAAAATLEDKVAADHLKAASTHWLRHMAASAMLCVTARLYWSSVTCWAMPTYRPHRCTRTRKPWTCIGKWKLTTTLTSTRRASNEPGQQPCRGGSGRALKDLTQSHAIEKLIRSQLLRKR